MNLRDRLRRLEWATDKRESIIGREVLRRLTDDELLRYEEVLERAIARGEPVRVLPEDAPVVCPLLQS